MKRTVIALLSLALLLSGCGSKGPDSPTREINAVLDRYVAAYRAKDASTLAGLYSYPAKSIDVDGQESIMASRDEMAGTLALGFLFIEVYDFQLLNRTVNASGNTALVTATSVLDGSVFGTHTRATSQVEFALTNNDGWKISVIRTLSTNGSASP
jgi:ketosteroid isomerase-like protein